MMRLFALGLVFLLIPTGFGLVCLKTRLSFDLRSVSSQPGAFRDQIQALKMNMNTPSKTDSCQVNISVSYHQQQLTIISDDTHADFRVLWDYIYFDTTISSTTNWQGVRQTEHSGLAVYICAISDGCNKAGILNYLDWMISRDFEFFKINIVELLLGTGEASGLCYEGDRNVVSCSSKVCQLERIDKGRSTKMNCMTGFLASQSGIRFQLSLTINFHPTKSPNALLQYTCKYNQCNGNRTLDKVEDLIDRIYNVTSIWESLGYRKQPTIASTLTTTSQSSNALTTNEQGSSATTEDAQETDLSFITTAGSTSTFKIESETMSTMELATTFAVEMDTTSMIDTETTLMVELDTTSDIPEPEVHTELSSNSSPASADAVVETTTVETTFMIEIDITSNIPEPEVYSDLSSGPFSASTTETTTVETTLVDTPIPSLEANPKATTTSDVVTTDGVYLNDTEVIDSSTEPVTANDSGQIRSTEINIAVIVLVLSYLHLL